MKKLFIFLFSIISFVGFAQVPNQVGFDFTNPTSLNPSINPSTEDGGVASLTNYVFTNGLISVSFERATNYTVGAELHTVYNNNVPTHYMMLHLSFLDIFLLVSLLPRYQAVRIYA